ncbi:MAG TPA: GLPGLI family protein, partial [Bacteroidales bacterium]|nr:GLPGLI family protein [Bacteroidales bacterium]
MISKKTSAALFIFMVAVLINNQSLAQQVLDHAQFRFSYEFAMEFDTLTYNDTREDMIFLQVGPNVSKSYSYSRFYSDSLRASPDYERAMNRIRHDFIREFGQTRRIPEWLVRGAGLFARVYKNYPQGQVTVTDNIVANHYIYTDELHPQNWEILDSVKTILDYPVQMAVSDFRGRRWTAWFAPDIPISDGPWKLSGLPGLIMAAYDAKKHFRFHIVGIEKVQDQP